MGVERTVQIPVGELQALRDAANSALVAQGEQPTLQRLLNVVSAICTTERIEKE